MSCSVDNIVETGHNIEIAVSIEITCVSGRVVPGGLLHVFLEESLIVVVEG